MCRNCYQRGWHRQKRLKAQEQAMLLMQNQGQQQTSFDRQMPVTPNNNAAFNLQDIIRGIVTPPISLNTYLEQLNGSEISVGRCTSSSSNAIDSGSISIRSRLSTPQLTINESPIGDRVINEPEVIYLDQETEPFPREVSPVPLNEIYQAIGQQAAPVEFILLSSGSEDES
ncbi:hypothetical protein M3Y97_00690200 [Aphelenchoides bicaudatus]|nr:hypothetical protein M3Y97_00690200 [Aphelenchoides bicaudatus]